MTLQTERIRTLDEVRAFVEGNEPVDFELADRESAYGFVRRTLAHFGYHGQGKAAKGLLRAYLLQGDGAVAGADGAADPAAPGDGGG